MKYKNSLIGVFFTVLVIGLLILSGPARAIDVNLQTPDIDLTAENPQDVEFAVQIKINSNEFLPLMHTDLILDYPNDNSLTCKINKDNSIDNCDFLTVTSKDIKNLDGNYGYGYGYGYSPNYGYGYDFGYGYGYGYSGESGQGTINYRLKVDVSNLPAEFLNNQINVEAKVYGGNQDDYKIFTGKSSFNVNAEKETDIADKTVENNVKYSGSVEIGIPANSLPADATKVIISQAVPTANPTNNNFKILGKVYEFDLDGATKVFSNNIQVTLTYTDQDLIDAGLTDENKIYPVFYNTITGDWEQLTVSSRDSANNKLTFLTNHFTQFGLLADNSPNNGGGGSTGGTGGGDSSSRRNTPSDVIPEPTPEEQTPVEEFVTPVEGAGINTPESSTPTGFAAITGAVVGLLGTTGSIIALILAIGGIGTGSYFLVKKKKK